MALLLHYVSAGDGTLNHNIIMYNSMWNYLITVYIYYYHTYVMQISAYVMNNISGPGHNLAADACMGRTQLSPCIISVPGHSVPTGMPCQHAIIFMLSHFQIFLGNIHNIVTTTVTNITGVEPVSHIYIIKPTCCQNNPAESFLWMHLHQFQYWSIPYKHRIDQIMRKWPWL